MYSICATSSNKAMMSTLFFISVFGFCFSGQKEFSGFVRKPVSKHYFLPRHYIYYHSMKINKVQSKQSTQKLSANKESAPKVLPNKESAHEVLPKKEKLQPNHPDSINEGEDMKLIFQVYKIIEWHLA